MQQLAFDWLPQADVCFGNYFVSQENKLLVGVLNQFVQLNNADIQLYIWGRGDTGKSHLLQAACQQVFSAQLQAAYLPLNELIEHSADMLQGLESMQLLAIDDVQLVIGHKVWQEALFDLINRCRASNCHLLFAADQSSNELDILPDLRTRLGWGPVFYLQALTDNDKHYFLQQQAHQLGLTLDDATAKYWLQHYPRDMQSLQQQMRKLNLLSLASNRRLTIPFLKETLANL